MGGTPIHNDAGISQIDIERVEVLYPSRNPDPRLLRLGGHSGKRSNQANTTKEKQPWLDVVVPGVVTTTVRPVPTDFPKSSNDSKALELANKYSADFESFCLVDDVA